MSGRVGKSLALICAIATFIAAMGSSSVVSHAEDIADNHTLVAEPEQPVYEESEGDSGDKIIGDLLEASLGYDVCFFIQNKVDAEIPNEPTSHRLSEYSEAIRINNATSSDQFIFNPDFNESVDPFGADGFTARNGVLDQLSIFPTEQQIKDVFPDFNSQEQYVLWYVRKKSLTMPPNSDVTLHVDGVIRTRQIHSDDLGEGNEPGTEDESEPGEETGETPTPDQLEQPQEPTPAEPDKPAPADPEKPEPEKPAPEKPVPDVSELKFNVYSKELEKITADGEEYVGGFVVEVLDNNGNLLAQYPFGIHGQLIGENLLGASASAAGGVDASFGNDIGIEWGKGTDFVFQGQTYHVNVDTAYIKKVSDELQMIPLLFAQNEVKAGDIRISDAEGHVLANAASVPRVVNKHKITVTAGTTVQNDNGQTLTNNKAIITDGSLMKGHRLEATFNGSQTGPGESSNEITDIHIYDSNGREATAYYAIELKKGKLVLVANDTGKNSDNNSTGSAVTKVLVKDDNETVVSNSQHVLGAGRDDDSVQTGTAKSTKERLSTGDNDAKSGKLDADNNSSAEGGVLGARRSDTGDSSMSASARLALIVLCCMLISIIFIKRNKTE